MSTRVFVGTLRCNEGDYDRCIDAIKNQKNVNVTHVVFSDLPEKEAHNRLWQAWRDVKDQYQMFVKVDADTVLYNENVLNELWKLMQENPRVTGIQAPLLDYFTMGYINGLNCFSPKVTFRDTVDTLFCDRGVDVDHDIVIKANSVPETLRPAGWHCFHATPVQAFHYGLHRTLKRQTSTMALVRQAWSKTPDTCRTFALLGGMMAKTIGPSECNYTDEKFKSVFDAACKNYDRLYEDLKTHG